MTARTSGTAPGRRRGTRRALAAAATTGALLLAGCGGPAAAPTPAERTGAPVTVLHGDDPLEAAVAAVVRRHLEQRGHPVNEGEGPVDPWADAGGDTVVLADTLRLALEADPEAVLPAVDAPREAAPTPTSTSSEASLAPLDPAAPPRVPADPSETAAPPAELPDVDPAADADATRSIVEQALARAAAGGPVAAPSSPEADESAGASSAAPSSDEDVRVMSASRAPLRLSAVVTAATAARVPLDSVDDLNGRCAEGPAAVPASLAEAATGDGAAGAGALADRLGEAAGCRPSLWLTDRERTEEALTAGDADVALMYTVDPEIPSAGLVPLGDGGRVLPAGRIAALGAPGEMDGAAQAAVKEVLDRLDEDGLAELIRLTSGPDALSPEDAAQYWLVTHGLEEAPEGWVMPHGGWF